MADPDTDAPLDASAADSRAAWLAIIDEIGEESGYFQTLGPRHWAMFADLGPTLIVSFETIDSARARPGQLPVAHDIAADRGWSHLCLIADGETWFRDPAVYGFFDRLVDDAFFEDFDRVLFYGAGNLSYPACAFAVAAPGARVLALNPVATLAPTLAVWDGRFRAARKLDFTSRYGFAPDMVDGAAQVTLIYDPVNRLDAMHSALFHAPAYVTRFAARMGGALEPMFARLGVLPDLIAAAVDGRLTPSLIARLWRQRRDDQTYLKSVLSAAATTGKKAREIAVCQNVTDRLNLPRFRKRLAELTGKP